ncbi:MAG TPA: biotin carboxylase N-terminal domain-containing protein [Burkholderiales bacterium]|nr:biotin carboxylase N-terminal domain-containing protein [Burkholderiales bacterium]
MRFKSLLVANRGEIALRVMRTAKRMGLRTIAVYSDADRDAPHVRFADEAAHIGGPAPRDSYLNIESILKAGGDAVHPGYGFLSENPGFAEAVQKAGRVWIGPPSSAMRAMGDKANAKAIAAKAGVPVLPTYEKDPEFPVMIKALAGGGGRGIRIVLNKKDLAAELERAQSEAEHSFGDSRVLLEKALIAPRHVEVQIFADCHGNFIHLGERECSIQRRHQKLLEESPSIAVDAKLRKAMGDAAIKAARAVGYVGAGTVEFLLGTEGDDQGRFWFMEMNTRLQVEHPVTEALTGLDLVEWQLRVAAGEKLPLEQEEVRFSGHAIEVRLCAEDPARDFLPQTGTLALWRPSSAVRVDHALDTGAQITPFYDSMIAKLIAHAPTRAQAAARLVAALDESVALGLPTNKEFLSAVLQSPAFAMGETTTAYLGNHQFQPQAPDPALAASLLAGDYGEWTGWSNNPDHRGRARFDSEVISFCPSLQTRERSKTLPHVVDGATVHYALGGASFTLRNTLYDPPGKKGLAGSDGRLAAPMNGRVVAVNAEAGQSIEAGKPLVVLEAMKMEHGLSVSFPVKVKSVHVKAGAQVAPGNLLLEFEPA